MDYRGKSSSKMVDLCPVRKQSRVNYNELELNSVQVNLLEFHCLNLSPSSFICSGLVP